jgi:hypothetical protein
MIAFLPGVDHGAHISDVEFGGQSQSNATASLSATDLARRCPRPSRRITGRSPPLRVHAIRRMLARWVPGTTCWRGAAAVAAFTHKVSSLVQRQHVAGQTYPQCQRQRVTFGHTVRPRLW